MAAEKIVPAGMAFAVQQGNHPALRPVPAVQRYTMLAEQIERLANDYQRAVFCRHQAEVIRRRWFAGWREEIAHLQARAAAGDPRFKNMTYYQLDVTARWRWSQSANGEQLMKLEQMFTAWAGMYLSSAQLEVLNHRLPPG